MLTHKLYSLCLSLYGAHSLLGWCQCSFMKWNWVGQLQGLIWHFILRELDLVWSSGYAIVRLDFFCWYLKTPKFTTSAVAQITSSLTLNSVSKTISMNANSLLLFNRILCESHAASRGTTSGTGAAHSRFIFGPQTSSQSLLFFPERRMDFACIWHPQALNPNCLADNFCIIAVC